MFFYFSNLAVHLVYSTSTPDEDIQGGHLIEYTHNEVPVFLVHYCMDGEPQPLTDNIACLDYSVAKAGGELVAYRWDDEEILKKNKFVAVDKIYS